MTRILFLVLGLLCVALAVIGVFLPLMPTTIFLILAAGCFARSSPRLEAWLVNHVHLGPPLRAWREHGAIPRRGKVLACLGIGLGYAGFWLGAAPAWPLAVGVAVILAGIVAFILSRPSGPRANHRP